MFMENKSHIPVFVFVYFIRRQISVFVTDKTSPYLTNSVIFRIFNTAKYKSTIRNCRKMKTLCRHCKEITLLYSRANREYADSCRPHTRRPVIANPQGEAIHTGSLDCFTAFAMTAGLTASRSCLVIGKNTLHFSSTERGNGDSCRLPANPSLRTQ
jgi:hypothetical protein